MTSSVSRRTARDRTGVTAAVKPLPTLRCGIYTRKSTSEGLDGEFTSLDAQREACENFIRAQAGEGWVCLPDRYDDGGFTGGNTERPALKRLLEDVEAERLDAIVLYKIDRLSRSLMDFARLIELFEKHHVAIVSITQSLDTGSSLGRLTLNILLSFAQFERELISERTKDKMGAARRKGRWSGGAPPLGFDAVDSKLLVNDLEADRVRQIFRLYIERQSLLEVVKELNRRNWVMKRWATKNGKIRGGTPFDKNNVYNLLRNVVYIGKVCYENELYEGEHHPIVEPQVFQAVQHMLKQNALGGKRGPRLKSGGILGGLVRCPACDCSMTHTYSSKGVKRYRYYVCRSAQKRGRATCPFPSIPAAEIERYVVDQIRGIGRDSSLITAAVAEISRQAEQVVHDLNQEATLLTGTIQAAYAELSQVSVQAGATDRTAEIQGEITGHQERLKQIRRQLTDYPPTRVDQADVETVFAEFDALWEAMTPVEQNRLLRLVIRQVVVDGPSGEIELGLHPTGLQTLVAQRFSTGIRQ